MWKCIQCAVQGRNHILENTPCQDKVFFLEENNCSVISLADGAGSAKYSHYGADEITKDICKTLSINFDSYFQEQDGMLVKKQMLATITDRLNFVASHHDCKIEDLASTLLVLAVKDHNFILLHIGDGVIGYMRDKDLKVASKPTNGEFSNTTVFTTSKNAISSIRLIKGNIDNITGFVLMSDGSEASLYHKKENRLAPAVKNIMRLIPLLPLDTLQAQLEENFKNIIAKNTGDDCSIIFLAKDDFKGYAHLSETDKYSLFGIPKTENSAKRVKRYDAIIHYLQDWRTEKEISKFLHLKPKYVKSKYINTLLNYDFIECHNHRYKSILIMEK